MDNRGKQNGQDENPSKRARTRDPQERYEALAKRIEHQAARNSVPKTTLQAKAEPRK